LLLVSLYSVDFGKRFFNLKAKVSAALLLPDALANCQPTLKVAAL